MQSAFLADEASPDKQPKKKHGGARQVVLDPPVYLLFDEPTNSSYEAAVIAGRSARTRSAPLTTMQHHSLDTCSKQHLTCYLSEQMLIGHSSMLSEQKQTKGFVENPSFHAKFRCDSQMLVAVAAHILCSNDAVYLCRRIEDGQPAGPPRRRTRTARAPNAPTGRRPALYSYVLSSFTDV